MVLEERVEEQPALVMEKPNHDDQLLKSTADVNAPPPLGLNLVNPLVFTTLQLMSAAEIGHDDVKSDKSDYKWLLSPPDSPVLNMESQKSTTSQFLDSCSLSTMTSMPRNVRIEPLMRSSTTTKQNSSSPSEPKSSSTGSAKSLSGGTKPVNHRAATPTGRPKLSATIKPSRSSTPSRVNMPMPFTKPLASSAIHSSAKAKHRSSTPTNRSSLPTKNSNSRSATPTKCSATTSSTTVSAPPIRSSSTLRSSAVTSKTSINSGAKSLSVNSASSKNNLKPSLSERPASASRIRPGALVSKSSSRKSITPGRVRASNGNINSSNAEFAVKRNQGRSNGGDDVNPVVIGTEMVERIVNMRKLAPPNKGNNSLTHNDDAKKHSVEKSGFGRSLSSKSLDMAIRHMDITRSIAGKPRSRMPIISRTTTTCSVRSGPSQSESSGLDSPLTTNSNTNSELSLTDDSLSK